MALPWPGHGVTVRKALARGPRALARHVREGYHGTHAGPTTATGKQQGVRDHET